MWWMVVGDCSLSHVLLLWPPWTVAPQDSSVYEISQARILGWVAISFSGGLFPRPGLRLRIFLGAVDALCRQITDWATRKHRWWIISTSKHEMIENQVCFLLHLSVVLDPSVPRVIYKRTACFWRQACEILKCSFVSMANILFVSARCCTEQGLL